LVVVVIYVIISVLVITAFGEIRLSRRRVGAAERQNCKSDIFASVEPPGETRRERGDGEMGGGTGGEGEKRGR